MAAQLWAVSFSQPLLVRLCRRPRQRALVSRIKTVAGREAFFLLFFFLFFPLISFSGLLRRERLGADGDGRVR